MQFYEKRKEAEARKTEALMKTMQRHSAESQRIMAEQGTELPIKLKALNDWLQRELQGIETAFAADVQRAANRHPCETMGR